MQFESPITVSYYNSITRRNGRESLIVNAVVFGLAGFGVASLSTSIFLSIWEMFVEVRKPDQSFDFGTLTVSEEGRILALILIPIAWAWMAIRVSKWAGNLVSNSLQKAFLPIDTLLPEHIDGVSIGQQTVLVDEEGITSDMAHQTVKYNWGAFETVVLKNGKLTLLYDNNTGFGIDISNAPNGPAAFHAYVKTAIKKARKS